MKLLTLLVLAPYWGHPDDWVVQQNWDFEHNGKRYRVPKGFITDLASTPIGNVNDESRWAAVAHDWNYCAQDLTREQADDLFREMLVESGYSKLRAWVYWRAVRMFGWRYWNRRKREPLRVDYDFVSESFWQGVS